MEKYIGLMNGCATVDWILDRERWRGSLVATQVPNGPYSA